MTPWPPTWSAHWIWWERPRPDAPPNRFALLRRTFDLDDVPGSVPCRVSADSRYVLHTNGAEVARGPARSVPERLAWTEVDLAPALRPGPNVVAALVRFYGRPGPWWRPAIPSGHLGFGCFALEAPAIDLATDATWRGRPAPYATDVPSPLHGVAEEHLDGRHWPDGWEDVGFVEDDAWVGAVELRAGGPATARTTLPVDPYPAMEADGIAPLTAEPVVLGPLRTGVLNAGRITLATPWVEVRGPAGATVEVVVGEDEGPDGVVTAPRAYRLRYTLAGRPEGERVEGFDPVGFRFVGVSAAEDVEVTAAGAVERRYPRAGGASFRCADERLNRIWDVGARTLDVCSTDAFLDCPGREQRAWLGDAYVHSLVTFVTNPDWRLVRRHLRICAHSRRPDGLLAMAAVGDLTLAPTTIPDYSLHWLRTLGKYVIHSGDVDLAEELVPTAAGVLDWFEAFRGADGLLHAVPGWVFVDWATTERAEVTTALDALYAMALSSMQSLSGFLGDRRSAKRAEARAARTRQALDALWDEDKGVFVDAADTDGPRRRVSQQTNALCISAGAASHEQAGRILDAILDPDRLVRTPTTADVPLGRGLSSQYADPGSLAPFDEEESVVAAQPFFRHFVHDAVCEAGRRDLLPGLLLDWWPQVEAGATTFGEYWEAPPGRASRAHAWSATPTYDLTHHVLGVRPAEPGCRKAIVDPLHGFGPMSGSVPTPHGFLHVRVDERGAVEVDAPDGVEVLRPS
ncbi:MAG: hypothetical protein H0U26_05400 [Acidimicrobiia bacterium]|nr:hypothetical protein [Acidimicrobiia bacterium]